MLFDHIIFQIERFTFIFDDEKVDFVCFGNHFLFSERIGREILSESFLEIFSFPDIQNSSFPVFEQVNSGIIRYFADIGGKHIFTVVFLAVFSSFLVLKLMSKSLYLHKTKS